MKYMNLIFCKHDGDPKSYLFELPMAYEVGASDIGRTVIVDTIRGEVEAKIVSRNIIVPASAARDIALNTGAYLPLKKVVGVVQTRIARLDEDLPF